MDYIFFSAIIGITLLFLTVSYDIACQWKQHLLTQMQKLPARLQLDPNTIDIQFGLPVWHASAHEVSCQMENGLGLQEGMGRTDGEGIERTWADMNTVATSTKEMGEGARHDTLDDHFSFHNFKKNINLGELIIAPHCARFILTKSVGETLLRKLLIAIDEQQHQINCFKEINAGLDNATREDWELCVLAWEADRSKLNPYLMDKTGAQVRYEMQQKSYTHFVLF